MIQNINSQLPHISKAATQAHLPRDLDGKQDQSVKQNASMEKVSLHYSSETAATYSASLSVDSVADKSYEMLRKLVTNMLEEQGIDYLVATGSSEIDISNLSQEEAQKLVAEDGYFGIDKTSQRIVDFAIAAAGGDASRLDAIKEGVMDGFNEAEKAFGGSLPDISHSTLDAVMEKLDAWAAEAQVT